MVIQKAGHDDLEEILTLQKLAYQSEAKLLDDWTIQPLTQTEGEVEREFFMGTILKAVDHAGSIIGSVRCVQAGDTCRIAKLFVHPCRQNEGLGTALIQAVERVCPSPRYELFTSVKSLKNIRFYEKRGYVRYLEKEDASGTQLVWMERRV